MLTKIIYRCLLIALFLCSLLPGIPARSAPLDQGKPANTASVIQAIRARGNVLIAGVPYDLKPFAFIDAAGEVVGFDVDLVRAMAGLWGVQVQFVPVTAADQVQKVAAGTVDLTTSLARRWEQATVIDFTQTYVADGQSLLVRAGGGIENIASLDGKTVAVVRGSTAGEQFDSLAATSGVTATVLPFQEYPAALAALVAGQVDALAAASNFVRQATQDNPALAMLALPLPPEPYAFAVPNGDLYFRRLVDFSLQFLKTGGVYDQLWAKWLPAATPYPLEILPGHWPYTLANSPATITPTIPSRVEAIQERGKLVVGVQYDFAPFGFSDARGQLDGFDVALAHEFAARWLGDSNAVDLVPVTAATAIPMLAGHAVDMVIAALGYTWERADQVDFSQTYFSDGQALLVGVDSGITGVADLDGKRVAAISGSTALANLRAGATARGVTPDILPFQEVRAALQALAAGQVDALADDRTALAEFAQANPALRLAGEPFATTAYAIGLPKFDDPLRDLVNFTLQAMKLDGTYDALAGQWLPGASPYPVERWPGTLTASPAAIAFVTRPAASNTPTPTLTPGSASTVTPAATKALILIPTPTPTPPATGLATSRQTIYHVQANDTLSSIAAQFYGDQLLWPQIYEANIDLIGANPNVLAAGTVLVIPAK